MLFALFSAVVAVVVAGLLYQQIASAADRRRFADSTHRVQLPTGERLHVQCAGEGVPAVVLEAGIGATSLSWALVQPRVAEFTSVCSYDRAGLGRSDPGSTPVSATVHAASLEALLRAADIPPPYVLAGHSYGSLVIHAYAQRHPERVAGLVFVDPIHPSDWVNPSAELQRQLRGGVFLSRLGALLARVGFVRVILGLLTGDAPGAARGVARLFGSKVEGVLSRLVGEVQKLPPNSWPIVQACWSQPKCFTAIADHLAGLPSSAREVADRSLGDIPLIVISAAQGWAAQRDVHERLASLSSRGRVVVAKQSGHWAQLDEPEIVVEAIRELVETPRAGLERLPHSVTAPPVDR